MARYSPMVGAAFSCAAPGSRELNIMVLERERADPFTRRIEEGVEYRWRGNADGRFADPTQKPPLGMMRVSTLGISAIRIES